MKNNGVLFVGIILLMTILTAMTFVGSRVLFSNQPGIEDVISTVWTVALVVVLYKLMRLSTPSKDATRNEMRQNMWGNLVFLCEMLAVVCVIVFGLILGNVLTSGSTPTPMLFAIGFLALLSASVPAGVRLIRVINRQSFEGQ
jgi:hypothetical protein